MANGEKDGMQVRRRAEKSGDNWTIWGGTTGQHGEIWREVGVRGISQVNKFERQESLRVFQDNSEEEGIIQPYMSTVYCPILRFCFHYAVRLSQ